MKQLVTRFLAQTQGATGIEYALIVGLVSLGVLAALQQTASAVGANFITVSNAFQ